MILTCIKKFKIFCSFCILPVLYLFAFFSGSRFCNIKKDLLIWGVDPIINNKYWSEALKQEGYNSLTLMSCYYSSINKKEDFDIYVEDFEPAYIPFKGVKKFLSPYLAFIYIVFRAQIVHFSFNGGPLGITAIREFEIGLLRLANVRIVSLPYGSDAYCYSHIVDTNLRHALLCSYPMPSRIENQIRKRIEKIYKISDIVIHGFMIDGAGRWDVACVSPIIIDTSKWILKDEYSSNNGINGLVKIIHTPNHRGFKGTEFLLRAIEELKEEGLQIELILLEKVQNDEVRSLMKTADILAEQFIFTGYALSGMEGMASGLPVLANLDHEAYTRLYRRYSYLNECPILSTTPESLKENLRTLILHPQLREQLGRAGRLYVEKYHSFKAAQYLFGSIYSKILDSQDVDLMNLFHPLKSDYVKNNIVNHPLIDNKLPKNYFEE